EPSVSEPKKSEETVSEPSVSEQSVSEPSVSEQTVTEPMDTTESTDISESVNMTVGSDITLPEQTQVTMTKSKPDNLNNRFYRFLFGLANSPAQATPSYTNDPYYAVSK
ncbi:hypothetical protein EBU95_01950, partial [bacterium]|nr:hypothetical protein [bacterium]